MVHAVVVVADAVAVRADVRVAAFVRADGFATVGAEPGVVVEGGIEVAVDVAVAVLAFAAVRAEVDDGCAGKGGRGREDVAFDGDVLQRTKAAAVADFVDVGVFEVRVLHVVAVGGFFVARARFVPDAFCANGSAADAAAGDVVAEGGTAGIGGGVEEVVGGFVRDFDAVCLEGVVVAVLVGL